MPFALLVMMFISCGKEKETNKQPMDQYNLDNSNNYNYIFKDVIKKNREEEEKNKKGPFTE
jgi:hypothetical protein